MRPLRLLVVCSVVFLAGAGSQAMFNIWPSQGPAPSVKAAAVPKTPLPSPPSKTAPKKPSAPNIPTTPLPATVSLNVPAQSQMPQLPNGCEVTSLSMLLTAVNHPVDKMTLAKEQPYDPTKRVLGANGQIVSWGNPNVGFVGTPYKKPDGYGIYHGPLTKLLNKVMPGRALDLTGKPFKDILEVVASGRPVVVWTTATFKPTNDWVTWQSPTGTVKATMQEHAVLLVGYNKADFFINNPLDGAKSQAVKRAPFVAAWKQLGQQALTVTTGS